MTLYRSVGLVAAGRAALSAAGVGIDDVGAVDLYSCSPCAIQIRAEALGLSLDEGQAASPLTGSMPYFGGPGNNHTSHGIACVAGAIRAGAAALGLATGLGWYLTKHSVGVYGASPPPRGWRYDPCTQEQQAIDVGALELLDDPAGEVMVQAMTVLHDRTGQVTGAPVFAQLASGARVVADAAPDLGAARAGISLVGATVLIRRMGGVLRHELTTR